MRPLTVVGPSDADRADAVARLASRLAERGEVATVHRTGSRTDGGTAETRSRTEAVGPSYERTGEDTWAASGIERTFSETLDALAPSHDYVVVEGDGSERLPTVALGGAAHEGATLATAPDADALDVEAAVNALDAEQPRENLESLVSRVKASPASEYAGAIATFTGRVRTKEGPEDPPTEHLEFEKYDDVAEEEMAAIESELTEREGVHEVELYHKTGVVEAEADIVFVVVLAGHRQEAFETVEDGLNRLKAEVPLFKKEVTVDDEFWAHQRDDACDH